MASGCLCILNRLTAETQSRRVFMLTAKQTREMVLAKVRQMFPNDDSAEILAILNLYGAQPDAPERERVELACLKLSEGNKDKLLSSVRTAIGDPRDVLAPAEYPGFCKIGYVGVDKLDSAGRSKLIYEDLRQYLSWLQDTDEPDMSEYQEELDDHD